MQSSNTDETITNRLICGDSRTVIQSLPNNAIDTVVTSPPYWGARDYDTNEQIGFEESMKRYIEELVSVFTEIKHVMKDSGVVFIVVDDMHQSTAPGTQNAESNLNEKTSSSQGTQYRFDSWLKKKSLMGLPERLIVELVDSGWVLRNKIVWEKPNPLPEPSAVDRFQQSWEPVFMLTPEPQYHFNEEYATTVDRWEIPTSSRSTVHPAPLPVELCLKCIEATTPQDGVVFDPFCGSGSTCIAAERRNKTFVGVDINEDYLQEAREYLGTEITDTDSERNVEEGITGQQQLNNFV